MNLHWPAQWGLPGAITALALLATLPLGTWLTPHWQAQADALQLVPARRPAAQPMARVQLQRQLPTTGPAPERVADLLRLAPRHGVEVLRTQQQIDRSGPLPRLQLGLSASGRYGGLRAFVAAALQADPGLALDRLQWRRSSSTVDQLEAELQWSLLQSTGADGAAP